MLPDERRRQHHEHGQGRPAVQDVASRAAAGHERTPPDREPRGGEREREHRRLGEEPHRGPVHERERTADERGRAAEERVDRVLAEAEVRPLVHPARVAQGVQEGLRPVRGVDRSGGRGHPGRECGRPAPVLLRQERQHEHDGRGLQVDRQRQRQRGTDREAGIGQQGQQDQVRHVEVDLAVDERAEHGHIDRHEGERQAGGDTPIEAVLHERERDETGEGRDREHVPGPEGEPHASAAERNQELAQGGQQRRVDVALVERPTLGEIEGRPHVVAGVGVLAALAEQVRVQHQREEAADRQQPVARSVGRPAQEREHATAREPDEPERRVGQLQARGRAHLDERGEDPRALPQEERAVHHEECDTDRRPRAERRPQKTIDSGPLRLLHALPVPRGAAGVYGTASMGAAR